ncbi:MAG: hypothetical protein NT062_07300, partial [Proteobacteria bacterium]|nr:hypothetical protein [Pseudomonadota bacterium]
SWLYARRGQVMLSIALVGNLALVIAFSRLASPLMLTPTLIGGVIAALAANPRMLKRRGLLFGWGALACTLPLLLEAIGVLPQSWSLVGGIVTVRSTIFSSPGIIDGVMLIAANTGFVLIIGIYAISTRRIAHEAKRRIQIQKWHLEQMLPRV